MAAADPGRPLLDFAGGDPGPLLAAMTEDVVVRSPIAFRPYEGKAEAARLLIATASVLGPVEVSATLRAEDQVALVFDGAIDGKALNGVYLAAVASGGSVTALTVFLRPASALDRVRVLMLGALDRADVTARSSP